MDFSKRSEANLRVIRKFIPDAKSIRDQASHAVCYRFCHKDGVWEEMNVNGVLFLLELSNPDQCQFFILNRAGLENFTFELGSVEKFYQLKDFFIFNISKGNIIAIWIYDEEVRSRIRDITNEKMKSLITKTLNSDHSHEQDTVLNSLPFIRNSTSSRIIAPGGPLEELPITSHAIKNHTKVSGTFFEKLNIPKQPSLLHHATSLSPKLVPNTVSSQRIEIGTIFSKNNVLKTDKVSKYTSSGEKTVVHPTSYLELGSHQEQFSLYRKIYERLKLTKPTFSEFVTALIDTLKEDSCLKNIHSEYCRKSIQYAQES